MHLQPLLQVKLPHNFGKIYSKTSELVLILGKSVAFVPTDLGYEFL